MPSSSDKPPVLCVLDPDLDSASDSDPEELNELKDALDRSTVEADAAATLADAFMSTPLISLDDLVRAIASVTDTMRRSLRRRSNLRARAVLCARRAVRTVDLDKAAAVCHELSAAWNGLASAVRGLDAACARLLGLSLEIQARHSS